MKSSKPSLRKQGVSLSQKSETLHPSTDTHQKFQRNKLILRTILILTLLFMLVLTFETIKRLFILVFIVVLNFAFAYLKRINPISFIKKYFYGIEIILISTVTISIAYGHKIGAIMGPLLMVVNYFGERRSSGYFLLTTILYGIIGFVSYFIKLDIVVIGIIMTLSYNVVAHIFSRMFGANLTSLIVFNVVNVGVNVFMFVFYAGFILEILV